jgi:hypothetical protein
MFSTSISLSQIYPVGIPAIYLSLVWSKHRLLSDPVKMGDEEANGWPTGELFPKPFSFTSDLIPHGMHSWALEILGVPLQGGHVLL